MDEIRWSDEISWTDEMDDRTKIRQIERKMDDWTVFNCRLTRSRPTKLITNSISNSIILKASTALPTASNSISNSDSTTATQRLKQQN